MPNGCRDRTTSAGRACEAWSPALRGYWRHGCVWRGAIPVKRQRIVLTGDVPSPAAVPSGCPFHPRCPDARDVCRRVVPDLVDPGDGRRVACLLRYSDEQQLQAGFNLETVSAHAAAPSAISESPSSSAADQES
ncbi:MAG: hypothetical protein HOH74_14730 [Gemmatimonadetes bacterium]|nr:hypothetical protein [Gemmatimonadota bacterium]